MLQLGYPLCRWAVCRWVLSCSPWRRQCGTGMCRWGRWGRRPWGPPLTSRPSSRCAHSQGPPHHPPSHAERCCQSTGLLREFRIRKDVHSIQRCWQNAVGSEQRFERILCALVMNMLDYLVVFTFPRQSAFWVKRSSNCNDFLIALGFVKYACIHNVLLISVWRKRVDFHRLRRASCWTSVLSTAFICLPWLIF